MTQQDDITQRLRDNAELDEAEHGNARVVQLEREAADEIERLRAELSKLRAPVADERAAVDPCGYVAVKVSAVDWLKDKFPALTIKAGLCERIGGRLYTITRLMRDHDTALASAPVADESPMAKMADALREKARQEQQTYQDRRAQATEWGPLPEGTEADLLTRNAPVAHVAGDETSRYFDWAKDRSAWEMPVGTPVYYSALASAPVADANRWRWISAQYDDMKTSEVERFLELLGLDASEPYARLGEFVDRMTGDAGKPAASDADDIPDFGGGSGNKAKRRAAALQSQRQASAPVADERAAFETWANNSFELHRHAGTEYSSRVTQCAWAAWEARAALSAPQAEQGERDA